MKTLTIAALAVLSASTLAQDWQLGAVYSFGNKDYAVVASNKVYTLEDVLGKGLKLDVHGFAGVTDRGRTIAGFSLTKEWTVAKNTTFTFGPALEGDVNSLKDLGFAVYAGFRVRGFNF